MELFSPEFLSALLSIIVIDLVLAGDNAIVIGLAARKLPKTQQKKAIIWGTVGAIVIRMVATITVVWLLKIPGLLLIGGILLVWIAYKLLIDDKGHDIKAEASFMAAVKTIVIADALMGLDNVIGVAGAANGHFLLVVIGLIISVPIMIWGSSIILRLVERYPIIISIGAGILAFTASKMIMEEKMWSSLFEHNSLLKWGLSALIVGGVLLIAKIKKRQVVSHAN
ncbi:MAG TPA: TerC family protein [Pseudoneobacillus sp.]|nr:TerC family protein [Pseudoneobacillus sp.]